MIVAGFGFRAAVTAGSLADALGRAREAIAEPAQIRAVATVEDKADHPEFRAFARTLGARILPVAPAALETQETATRSSASLAARATGSVAEAAALAAAGQDARLLAPRAVSGDGLATCALAEEVSP